MDKLSPRILCLMRKIMMFPRNIVSPDNILNNSWPIEDFIVARNVLVQFGLGVLEENKSLNCIIFKKIALTELLNTKALQEYIFSFGLEFEDLCAIMKNSTN